MEQAMLEVEEEAEQIINEFLDKGMVPNAIKEEISELVENGQSTQALEMILDYRRN
jgi:hypothetical protein